MKNDSERTGCLTDPPSGLVVADRSTEASRLPSAVVTQWTV